MNYSNLDILTAILNKFIQPLVAQFAQGKMSSFPFVQMIENKVRSTGFVSGSWNLTQELSPLIGAFTSGITKPLIKNGLSNIPDEAIPEMAHNVVDAAINNGGLVLLEGKIELETSDLIELKKLLNCNLPFNGGGDYQIIMPTEETVKEDTEEVEGENEKEQ